MNNETNMLGIGTKRCQCPTCGEYFSSETAFDLHRIGAFRPINTRRCLIVEEMQSINMAKSKTGHWITSERDSQPLYYIRRELHEKQVLQGQETKSRLETRT